MQLINVKLIPAADRQDGDGKCRITVRYADGSVETLYARELPGNDAADDWFLATLIEAKKPLPEAKMFAASDGSARVIVQWDTHHSDRRPRVTFYPRT